MGRMLIDAPDAAGLAAFGRDPATVASVRRVSIHVDAWRAPQPGWVGRLGPIGAVRRLEVRVPHIGPGRVRVSVDLARPRPIREVIGAVMYLLTPAAEMPYPQSPSVAANGGLPPWLPVGADVGGHFLGSPLMVARDGAPVDVVSGIKRNPDDPPPNRPAADAELVMVGGEARGFGTAPIGSLTVTHHGVVVDGADALRVLIDVQGRPTRRWQVPGNADARGRLQLRMVGDRPRWRLFPAFGDSERNGWEDRHGGPWLGLDASPEATLGLDPGAWWYIDCDIAGDVPPLDAAELVLRIALSGVVITGETLPDAVGAHLSQELVAIVCEPLPAAGTEPITWEMRSVRQRRAVVRGHASSLVAHDRIRPMAAVEVAPPSVTGLLVTRRPRLAALALRMMRDQTYPRLDIVVGLHGVPSVPELDDEVASAVSPVELLTIEPTTTLGEALGIATTRARGSFLAKIDDDDIYGPEHVWDLIVGRALSGATVVGKGAEFVMLDQLGITVRREIDGFGWLQPGRCRWHIARPAGRVGVAGWLAAGSQRRGSRVPRPGAARWGLHISDLAHGFHLSAARQGPYLGT